ncbi:MAG: xanthine dehydrogenase family protein molybdopterin-binding subunit [Limnohabitans sp.]|nr:xanthine dehydrogenase family protein molybdopterin-binding subunit [Limnohabitans sp.]
MSPESLKAQPLLRHWLALGPGGQVRAFSGKVDLGQGISHALRLIVAEELRLQPLHIEMVPASTAFSPDEAVTSGSLSVQHSGAALRCAAAHWREACRQAMAGRLAVPLSAVRCEGGQFQVWGPQAHEVPGHLRQASYAGLTNLALWDSPIEPGHVLAAHAAQDLNEHASAPTPGRPDVAAKVFGEFEYIHDRVMPGVSHPMCHGMVFRPGTLSAEVIEPDMCALATRLQALPGVLQVVRDGVLLGVLAETERVLGQIAQQIEAGAVQGQFWRCAAPVPDRLNLPTWLKTQALDSTVVADTSTPVQTAEVRAVHQRVMAEFHRPFVQHASVGLCCALAQWRDESPSPCLEVWTHSQGIYNLRRDLALAFGLPAEQVQVSHVEGAGCYGHNGADDVAWDAAWLARLVPGRPVRVQWTRQAELGHAPLAPAMAVRIEAGMDSEGQLLEWTQTVWGQGHGTRPGRGQTPALLGAWQTADPAPVPLAVNAAMAVGGGSERNAQPPYDIARVKVLNHRVLNMPFRVSAMRALGAPVNVLAAESVMDELAHGQSQDPLAYRLAHLRGAKQARAVAVLQKAADMASWTAPASTARPEGWGRGLAYARYKNTGALCAVVVELVVAEKVKLHKLWIAADVGHVVDADGVINQLEGGALQAASWALCEAAQLSPQGITSNDWTRYPILKFSDMPEVSVALMPGAQNPSLGAGECSSGPTCAAIANAIFDAMGVRVRSMPFNPENLMRAIDTDEALSPPTF